MNAIQNKHIILSLRLDS